MARLPRATPAAVLAVVLLLGGLVCAAGVTAGIAFMPRPLERAAALASHDHRMVHGLLRADQERTGAWWSIQGIDASALPSDDDALPDRAGKEVIGLVHEGELIALDLPGGQRVEHAEAGWGPVWTMAFFVLVGLLLAVLALGAVAGRVTRRLPLWARGGLATAPFVLAGVVIGHLRSGEMVKVDVAVVLPLVALVLIGCAAGPRWYAATKQLAHQELPHEELPHPS